MELISTLKAGSEAIGLIASIAELVKKTKGPNAAADTPLRDVIHRVQVDAIRLSRDLENRLRNLPDRISDYGLNPAKTVNEQLADLSWYNFVTRSRLKALREECHAIYRQLTNFLDDVTAVLICAEKQQIASEAFKSGIDAKRDLDGLFLNPKATLGSLIDAMLATASRVTADLQSA